MRISSLPHSPTSPCHPPPSFLSKPHHRQCAPGAVLGCVGWRGDEGSEAQRCNRALSSSLCRAVASRGERSAVIQHSISTARHIFVCSFTFHDARLHNLFIYLFILQRQNAVNNGEIATCKSGETQSISSSCCRKYNHFSCINPYF